jgi:hypothetical protein
MPGLLPPIHPNGKIPPFTITIDLMLGPTTTGELEWARVPVSGATEGKMLSFSLSR